MLDTNVINSDLLLTLLLDLTERGSLSFAWTGNILDESARNKTNDGLRARLLQAHLTEF